MRKGQCTLTRTEVEIWAGGRRTGGQLGGNNKDPRPVPTPCGAPPELKMAAMATFPHTIVLIREGKPSPDSSFMSAGQN